MRQINDTFKIVNHFRNRIPVDVEGLALALGLLIRKSNLPDDISGKLHKLSDEYFEIEVNEKHSDNRQRFTIAHELGHFIFHKHLIGDGIVDDCAYRSSNRSNPNIGSNEETEANKFAANLLMPGDLISQYVSEGKRAEQLADLFGVSLAAMKIRVGSVPR